ncbi:MAG: 16S rRNA (guanine(527)-N(7))-methyltransferase RsmG [Marinilabiliales bacterium]
MNLIKKYFPRITELQLKKLESYKILIEEWNKKINLISRQDISFFEEHHILHSLAISKCFSLPTGSEILDVGTGGGLPGIPLAILNPDINFTLIDSIEKKINVVKDIIQKLELNNASSVKTRVEDFEHKFDIIVARAVTSFPAFHKMCHSKINSNPNNYNIHGIIYLKGGLFFDEIISFKKIEIYSISDFYKEDFFKEKKIIFLPK